MCGYDNKCAPVEGLPHNCPYETTTISGPMTTHRSYHHPCYTPHARVTMGDGGVAGAWPSSQSLLLATVTTVSQYTVPGLADVRQVRSPQQPRLK